MAISEDMVFLRQRMYTTCDLVFVCISEVTGREFTLVRYHRLLVSGLLKCWSEVRGMRTGMKVVG